MPHYSTSPLLLCPPQHVSRFKTTCSHTNGSETFSVLTHNAVARHTLQLRMHEQCYLGTVLKLLQAK
jgi:hypothetical protein